ncbi:disease resistance protein RPS6-like [Arachis ipaensis]|uniref:disease resistance protein RPS6-like n=1 Tax=Arachis ipaensis TaxID=130454 RepID=UPI0007AF1E93|nr:disease resistance protein RPS6-like [Arachis ipaensis]
MTHATTSQAIFVLLLTKARYIQVFIDNRISKGDENSSSVFKAIRDSNVSVVVLSKDYASSTWCMHELNKILKQKRHGKGHIMVPVFYKIDPSHIRKQIGTYKKAFEKHERDVKHNILLKWKAVLTEVCNMESKHRVKESKHLVEMAKSITTRTVGVISKIDQAAAEPKALAAV